MKFRIVKTKIGHFYVEYRRWFIWRRVCALEGWRTYKSFQGALDAVAELKVTDHHRVVAVWVLDDAKPDH